MNYAIPFLIAIMGLITFWAVHPTDPDERATHGHFRWLVLIATIGLIWLYFWPSGR